MNELNGIKHAPSLEEVLTKEMKFNLVSDRKKLNLIGEVDGDKYVVIRGYHSEERKEDIDYIGFILPYVQDRQKRKRMFDESEELLLLGEVDENNKEINWYLRGTLDLFKDGRPTYIWNL